MGIALLPGQEGFVETENGVFYAYCTERGVYFSCEAKTLEIAQSLCEDWIMRQERY